MNPHAYYAIDTATIPWEERPNERIGRTLYRKMLYTDPDSGSEIRLVRYPAGVINPAHTHPCGHGMYVLEGELVTHQGTYGPGTFVWFPEGQVMEHGASAAGDVVVLFITNKEFRMDYVESA
jgi:quercetin dioxygenase-like cupin family protein